MGHSAVQSECRHGYGRRITAILFADICGYSTLMERDEVGTVNSVAQLFNGVFRPLIGRFDGRIIQIMGDGIFAEFTTAQGAVCCGIEIQQALAARNSKLARDQSIKMRIGINIGDVIVVGQRIHGTGVNVAARLQAMAEAGGILVSRAVYAQTHGHLKVRFEPAGKLTLKNIADPVEAYSLRVHESDVSAATTALTPTPELLALSRPSIAILPFRNLTGHPELDVLCEGMAESLNCSLCQFREILVIAQESAAACRGASLTTRDIASKLGVRYLLDGAILGATPRLRITAKLLDASSGELVWANKFDCAADNLLELQDEIVGLVAGAMPVRLREAEQTRLGSVDLGNLDAYGLLQRGLARLEEHSAEANADAIHLFDRAIGLDPKYARAHSARSRAYNLQHRHGWESEKSTSLMAAFDSAQTAVALDAKDGKSAVEMGLVRLWMRQFGDALDDYSRAYALNPNDPDIAIEMANALVYRGRPREALSFLQLAYRLNPVATDQYWWIACEAYFSLREYRLVLEASDRMRDPSELARLKAASYAHLGELDRARDMAAFVLRKHPGFQVSSWADKQPEEDDELDHLVEGLLLSGLPE
ncbi:MAG: adenylate/guanylate cyclase domain-containing protein [Pseudomonadota bacterium]